MVKRVKPLGDRTKKRAKVLDEEIFSDEAEGSENLEDDFFENEENPEEKRIRLAKEVIRDIEEVAQNKEEANELLEQTGVCAI